MNKNKLLIFLIAGLLVSNILLIVFMMKGPGHHPPHRPAPREIIIERLHFDNDQVKQYDVLIAKHRKDISDRELQIMNLKNRLYSTLKDENRSMTDSLIDPIGKIQNEIEHIHYSHFADIKKLCKADQLNDYNELVNELARLFSPPPPPKKHD